jgi:hypothetical protein
MKLYMKGFIIGGDGGQIMVFERFNDPTVLFEGKRLPL